MTTVGRWPVLGFIYIFHQSLSSSGQIKQYVWGHNFLDECPVSSQSHNYQIWRRKKDGAIFMVCIGQTFWYPDLLSPLILMRSDQPYDLSGNDEGPALFWAFRFLFLNSVSPCIFLSPISYVSWCWDMMKFSISISIYISLKWVEDEMDQMCCRSRGWCQKIS